MIIGIVLLYIVALAVLLGVLIFVHELGHFIAAKRSGVRVDVFSFGFGPRLLGFKRGETDYIISAAPFGGYVKMAGGEADQEPTGDQREYLSKPKGIRALIVLAGPAMNFVLALVLSIILTYAVGVDTITTRVIGEVASGSPAEKAGLREGDTIMAVNGETVKTWDDAISDLAKDLGKTVPIVYERAGAVDTTQLDLAGIKDPYEAGMAAYSEPVIENAKIGGPAYKAGLRGGDKIVSIGGTPVASVNAVRKIVLASPDSLLAVGWQRKGELHTSEVRPKNLNGQGMIEVDFRVEKKHVGLVGAGKIGLRYSAWASTQFFVVLHDLLTLKVSRTMVGGPVRIGMIAGEALSWSVLFFFQLLIYISAQLSIVNLLPIPVLDGGQLLLLGVETARRKPISMRDRMIAQQIGFVIIIAMFLTLTFNDISSIFFKK